MTTPFIQVETTPNPAALRILPGVTWLSGAPIEISAGDDASGAPLAAELLVLDGICSVLIGPDFVTAVRSSAHYEWARLRPQLIAVVADFLLSGDPVVVARAAPGAPDFGDDMISAQIHDVIERFVRPMLARDGGEATLVRFDPQSGIAHVRMGGACGGCPSGRTTLKRGIEQTIKRYVPEVTSVEAIEERPVDADPKARFRAWVAAKWGSGRSD